MSQPPPKNESRLQPRLLQAALAGLLCASTVACSGASDVNEGEGTGSGGESSSSGGLGGLSGSASGGSTSGGGTSTATGGNGGDAAGGAAATGGGAGDGGAGGAVDEYGITSTTKVADLTLEEFSADCDELEGTVEIHPHCGGANSCRGLSYDSDIDVLTEHTCAGLNTCTGFSCVLPK